MNTDTHRFSRDKYRFKKVKINLLLSFSYLNASVKICG